MASVECDHASRVSKRSASSGAAAAAAAREASSSRAGAALRIEVCVCVEGGKGEGWVGIGTKKKHARELCGGPETGTVFFFGLAALRRAPHRRRALYQQ